MLVPLQNKLEKTIQASSACAAGERLPPSPGREDRQAKIVALESEVTTVVGYGGSSIVAGIPLLSRLLLIMYY